MAAKKGKAKIGGRKSVSKNTYRSYQGQEVRPVLYAGKHAGHGTYMAGMVNGQLVADSTGRPIPYKQIG
jgi:hypothetical protein